MDFRDFCSRNDKNLVSNKDAENLFNFLKQPEVVFNMMCFSDVGLPAISGIVEKIEKEYGNSPTFSLKNYRNRQMVGKMVKYILSFYGYEAVANSLDERSRIRNFSNSKYFGTSSVYTKVNDSPQFKIEVKSVPNNTTNNANNNSNNNADNSQ